MIDRRYLPAVPPLFYALLSCCCLLACSGDTDDETVAAPVRPAKLIEIADPRQELERLFPGTVVEYDRLKAVYKASDAALSQARTNLAYTRLEAPFAGRIVQVVVKNHESVKADQPIAILEGAERVDVELQMPTSFMAQVPERNKVGYRAGQRGLQLFKVSFGNQPDVIHEGYVTELETRPDPATLTYRVVVPLPAPEGQEILPGMTARVSIDLISMGITKPRIVVPGEALFSADEQALDQGEASVWLLDKQSMRVSRRAVKIGEISSFGVEVKEGLQPGDTIIGAGVHYLTEGLQVRELEREGGL